MAIKEKLNSIREFRRAKRRGQMDLEDYLKKTRGKGLSDDGRLIPDSTPMAPPIGYKPQPSMVEIVRNMVRSEKLAQEAAAAGMETFEESEDFDIGDDGEDLKSGFENDFDPPLPEVRTAVEAHKKAHEEAQAKGAEARLEREKEKGGGGDAPA